MYSHTKHNWGHSQHHCKNPHTLMPLFQNSWPLSLDSPQQGAVRVVYSRSQSNVLIKAWDAECFLNDASCSHLILALGVRCLKMHGRWLTAMINPLDLSSKRQHLIPVLLLMTFVIQHKITKARSEWNMMSFPWTFQNTLKNLLFSKLIIQFCSVKGRDFFHLTWKWEALILCFYFSMMDF